jgi:putative transposase
MQQGTDHCSSEEVRSKGGNRGAVPAARDDAGVFFRRKSKFGGLELSEAKRLRQLEEENRQLKYIVAEPAVDIGALKLGVAKKWSVRRCGGQSDRSEWRSAKLTNRRKLTLKVLQKRGPIRANKIGENLIILGPKIRGTSGVSRTEATNHSEC